MIPKRRMNEMEFPPGYCAALCYYANTQECCEGCAQKRDMSWFEPKPDLVPPTFPLEEIENMNARERMLIFGYYLWYITKGDPNEREVFKSLRSGSLAQAVQEHRVLYDTQTATPLHSSYRKADRHP